MAVPGCIEVRQTAIFATWLAKVRDKKAVKAIAQRIVRLQSGLLGDVQPVGEGVAELRIHVGAGYRVYVCQRRMTLVVLLCGGNKKTQSRDIADAKALAAEWET